MRARRARTQIRRELSNGLSYQQKYKGTERKMMLCNMLILQSVVSALTLTPLPSAAATPLLPSLSIDPGSISISGLSSGADFVVQLQVAHSVRDGCMHPSAYEFVTQDISNATWPLEHLNTWSCKAATHLKNAPLPSRPLTTGTDQRCWRICRAAVSLCSPPLWRPSRPAGIAMPRHP